MAKKRAAPRQDYPGVTFTSGIIRHVNSITMAADSSTAVAEEIATPGYSEAGKTGAFIVGAQVSPAPATAKMNCPTDVQYCVQIQSGAREAAAVLLNPDAVGFFAQLIMTQQITTSGLDHLVYPMPLAVSMPVPIIVMPKLTIIHKCDANVTEFANTVVFTEIFYRSVKIADSAYVGLLMQQQRTS